MDDKRESGRVFKLQGDDSGFRVRADSHFKVSNFYKFQTFFWTWKIAKLKVQPWKIQFVFGRKVPKNPVSSIWIFQSKIQQIRKQRIFRIPSAAPEHGGKVTIIAENERGTDQSSATLTVQKAGVDKKPEFSKTPQDHDVTDEEPSVKFSAVVEPSTRPAPTVKWFLNEKEIVSSEEIRVKWDHETGKTSIRIFQPRIEQVRNRKKFKR